LLTNYYIKKNLNMQQDIEYKLLRKSIKEFKNKWEILEEIK